MLGDRRHIVPLDGLRGIAVLMVMLGHFWLGQTPVGTVDQAAFTFVQNGWVGVDLFFVLSGFLITGILLETKGSKHCFRNFYARRMLRIFPLYWGFLLGYFVLLPAFVHLQPGNRFAADTRTQILFWAYASNFLAFVKGAYIPPGLNHFWTLAVEEQFYLLWPAIVFSVGTRWLKRICLGLILFALAFRVTLFSTPFHHTGGFVLTPARIDTLAIGALLAVIYFEGAGRELVEKIAPKVFLSALVALIILNVSDLRLEADQMRMQTFGFPLLAIMAASAISVAAGSGKGGSFLRSVLSLRPLVKVGKYSYAMYVFHLPLIVLLARAGITIASFPKIGGSSIPAAVAFSVLGSALTFVVAFASWQLYERHFLSLKRYFPRNSVAAMSLESAAERVRCA